MKNNALICLFGLFAILTCISEHAAAHQQAVKSKNTSAPQAAAGDEYPKNRRAAMEREWKRARDYTGEYLDVMPEEGLAFKPVPEVRSFAEQMLHLANANFMFAANASGRANPYKDKDLEKAGEYKTKPALIRVVMESYDFVINSISGMADAKLDESSTIFGMTRPRVAVLAAAFEHQTHHRGQTTVYLRLKGITPPREKLF